MTDTNNRTDGQQSPSCPAHDEFMPRCDYCRAEANSKRRCDDCGDNATTRTLRDGDIANLCDECYQDDEQEEMHAGDASVYTPRHGLNDACPVCGTRDHHAVMWAAGDVWNRPADGDVDMGFCGSCGAMYATPAGDDE